MVYRRFIKIFEAGTYSKEERRKFLKIRDEMNHANFLIVSE